MYTYQVVGLADENGRTYKCKYGTYNKKDGFVFNSIANILPKETVCNLINELFHENCWSLDKPVVTMTKEEIEQELGYKIEIKDDKKPETIKNDFFHQMFWL